MRLKTILTIIIAVSILTLGGCISKKSLNDDDKRNPFNFSFQAGINKGGMVENTDMGLVQGAGIDAFSGATRTGFNAGARVSYPIKRLAIETGLDYMNNGQTFTWNDPVNGYIGSRGFSTHQLLIPTTLNLGLFRQTHPDGLLTLKLGHMMQYNMISVNSEKGNIPEYSINRWSNGLTLGIASTPFRLKNGARAGLFLEVYRGSRIYEDHYNQPSFEIPGSSCFKFGILYKLR
jgi:hypothetical protein